MHDLGQPGDVLPVLLHDELEPPPYISAAEWERCSPWIEGALRHSHGTHELTDVLEDIAANRATLWIWERSALVTQISRFPRLTVCTFWLAGGDMRELMSKEPGVCAWAKRNGCNRIALHGRKGWTRVFERIGYATGHHSVFKEL